MRKRYPATVTCETSGVMCISNGMRENVYMVWATQDMVRRDGSGLEEQM